MNDDDTNDLPGEGHVPEEDRILDNVERTVLTELSEELWWQLMNPQQQHRVKVFAVVQRMFGMADGARNARQTMERFARMYGTFENVIGLRAVQYAQDEGVDLVGPRAGDISEH